MIEETNDVQRFDETKIQLFKHKYKLPNSSLSIDYIIVILNDPTMICTKIYMRNIMRIKKSYYQLTHNLNEVLSDRNLIEWVQLQKYNQENFDILLKMLNKPLYTYCLIDDKLIFAEFKPKSDSSFAIYDEFSKHALICGTNAICVSGETKIQGGQIEFDVNSGSFMPKKEDIKKLDKFKQMFAFPTIASHPHENVDDLMPETARNTKKPSFFSRFGFGGKRETIKRRKLNLKKNKKKISYERSHFIK
jgi:hypothetical protein